MGQRGFPAVYFHHYLRIGHGVAKDAQHLNTCGEDAWVTSGSQATLFAALSFPYTRRVMRHAEHKPGIMVLGCPRTIWSLVFGLHGERERKRPCTLSKRKFILVVGQVTSG